MPLLYATAEPGLSFGDTLYLGLLFLGLAVFAAIGALSHQQERAFSASVIYLLLGLVAAVGLAVLDLGWVDPIEDASLVELLAELSVIIALFATGLKLDRPLRRRAWTPLTRLLVVAMPLTIGAIALFGTQVMGLSLAAALALGAILAPTDPVLAGDLGVGPPGEEDEADPNFALTGEAGLNDGLAFPFVLAALFVATEGGTGWLGEWVLADVLYAGIGGLVVGAGLGYGIAALAVFLRDRRFLATSLDGWLAIATVLVIYGLAEVAGVYGFLAAFAGGVAFRRYGRDHEYNEHVHEGAEVVEKFGELALILLLGSMVTVEGLGAPGVAGWLLAGVLLLVIRPVAVLASLLRSRLPRDERLFVAWFGVRGVSCLYYVAVVAGSGALAAGELEVVVWTALGVVIVSILVHGVTASPLGNRLLDR